MTSKRDEGENNTQQGNHHLPNGEFIVESSFQCQNANCCYQLIMEERCVTHKKTIDKNLNITCI